MADKDTAPKHEIITFHDFMKGDKKDGYFLELGEGVGTGILPEDSCDMYPVTSISQEFTGSGTSKSHKHKIAVRFPRKNKEGQILETTQFNPTTQKNRKFIQEGKVRFLKKYESHPKDERITFIDLFCGLGAFHSAFTTSPEFECVYACDINEKVRDVYHDNYGIRPDGDIRKVNLDTLKDFDILCAGFPCQPFSIAGNGEGFSDTQKGNLFFDILTIIDAKCPPMCILENVKNLRTHDNGNTYKTIRTELEKRGYTVTSKVLNSAEYGSPQARKRIFIVATKGRSFTIPEGSGHSQIVSDIIDTTVTQSDINLDKYNVIDKVQKKTNTGTSHIQSVLVSKKTGKGGRQGERVYSIDSVGITVCASSGGPGAKTGLYDVNGIIRRLTVRETLGMFGFSQTYKFLETSDEEARFFLGNSIVVDVPLAFVPVVKEWFEPLR